MFRLGIVLLLAALPATAYAGCDFSRLLGYTISEQKTIVARVDNNVSADGFEGCSYGRVIVFSDNTGVRCSSYSYRYAYRPTAYLLWNGLTGKMCVEDELFDITQLH